MSKNKSQTASRENVYNISSTDIAGYAEFFESNNLEELMVEEKGTRILFRKEGVVSAASSPSATVAVPAVQAMPAQAAAAPAAAAPAPSEPAAEAPAAGGENYKKICSPLNGSFYSKPSPDDPPYVTEGQTVSAGQTLCMVEAMKSFNEIKSDVAGKIVKILGKDGDAVSDGQELFWIE